MKLKTRTDYRVLRHRRLRQKIAGTAARPRMCVSLSGKHIRIQFIDDVAAVTLAAVSTESKELAGNNNRATAQRLGAKAAEVALAKGIRTAVFDRGGHAYGGRVAAIAAAARAAGMTL